MRRVIEQIAGAKLTALVLLNIFLLFLFALANIGSFSKILSPTTWRACVRISQLLGRWRSTFLG
jgi:hypothetical protein